MPGKKHKILIVDDDPHVLESLADFLGDEFEVIVAANADEAIAAVKAHADIVAAVVDIKMAPVDGIKTARELKVVIPDLAIIFHTAHPGEYDEAEIDETERPYDYIRKGRSLDQLRRALRNAAERYDLRHRAPEPSDSTFYGLVGRSQIMKELHQKIHTLAASDQQVLILGETGAGKEMVAKALHDCSPRRGEPFVVAVPSNMESGQNYSMLFGAKRGSYTGSDYERIGFAESAGGGSLLLDEVGEYSDQIQTMLLRLVDKSEYLKLGEIEMRKSRARLLFATHRNLNEMAANGDFREDLWYRINGASIHVPPLRDRKEDIKLLAEFFLRDYCLEHREPPKFIDEAAYSVLLDYDWPGNVRELMKCITSTAGSSNSDVIFSDDVAGYLELEPDARLERHRPNSLRGRMAAYEREIIIETLMKHGGDVKATSESLVINRTNLYKKLKEHGIKPDQFRN